MILSELAQSLWYVTPQKASYYSAAAIVMRLGMSSEHINVTLRVSVTHSAADIITEAEENTSKKVIREEMYFILMT